MALQEITHHKCCMLTYIWVWHDDTCCKCFPILKPRSMSNSDISNTANNYRYSIFTVVAACTELVLRYIILFCGWKCSSVALLYCHRRPDQLLHHDTFHKCWDLGVIRLQIAEVHQWIYVPFDMKWHATNFTSVMWYLSKIEYSIRK